jgi:type I restriction enzyme S subunit
MNNTEKSPLLRFSEFTNEWNVCPLGEYLEQYQEKVDSTTLIPVYSSSRTGLKLQTDYFDNRKVTNDGQYGVVPEGYITYRHMSDDATFKFNLNNLAPKIAVSKEYPVFSTVNLNPHFLLYKLNHGADFKRFALEQKTGGTRTRLYYKKLIDWKTRLPSLEEQNKISNFLSTIGDQILLLKEKHALLKEYKKGVMQKLLSQVTRFKDENGKNFPDWKSTKFESVFERVARKNKENNLNVLTISAQRGLINQQKYFNKSVSAKDVTGYYLLNNGDFAYNKSYSKGYPMGAIKRLNNYDKGVVSTLYICFKTHGAQHDKFWEQYFEAGLLNREISKIAQEGARNHGLLNVSVTEFFRDITVHAPSKKEQIRIADFLGALDKKLELVSQQIEQTQTFKKGLLQQMFV